MNAPPITPVPGRSRGASAMTSMTAMGALEAIPRHVSNEGCQFIVAGTAANVGQKLSFAAGAMLPVTGTIRWVLGERIGFAFDRRIDAPAVTELSAHFATLKAIRLFPSSPDQDAR